MAASLVRGMMGMMHGVQDHLSSADEKRLDAFIESVLVHTPLSAKAGGGHGAASTELSPQAARVLAQREVNFEAGDLLWLCHLSRPRLLHQPACLNIPAPPTQTTQASKQQRPKPPHAPATGQRSGVPPSSPQGSNAEKGAKEGGGLSSSPSPPSSPPPPPPPPSPSPPPPSGQLPWLFVCGDVHGQFGDLVRLFAECGFPPGPSSSYLFLGDYVDRGRQSLECMALLLALQLKHPKHLFLLRGNHEEASLNATYGFFDECKRRASVRVFKAFTSAFDALPVAAVVAHKVFCAHGGISPRLASGKNGGGGGGQANKANKGRKGLWRPAEAVINGCVRRPCGVPESGLVADLLWSDPMLHGQEGHTHPGERQAAGAAAAAAGWGATKHGATGGGGSGSGGGGGGEGGWFAANEERGVGQLFGPNAVDDFLRHNGFDLILRAHQVVEDGYLFWHKQRVLTVFSAPNYCNEFSNSAAVVAIDANLKMRIHVMKAPPLAGAGKKSLALAQTGEGNGGIRI